MHYFSNKFQNPQRPLTFSIGDLKFQRFGQSVLKLVMTKSNFKI